MVLQVFIFSLPLCLFYCDVVTIASANVAKSIQRLYLSFDVIQKIHEKLANYLKVGNWFKKETKKNQMNILLLSEDMVIESLAWRPGSHSFINLLSLRFNYGASTHEYEALGQDLILLCLSFLMLHMGIIIPQSLAVSSK